MTLIYIYNLWLLTWVSYEYFKILFYVSPEDAKEWERKRLRARGNILPPNLNVKATALELYDHLIIESLNYQTK
jgi:hypothetical protein